MSEVADDWLDAVYQAEIGKMVRASDQERRRVVREEEVLDRLASLYGERKAENLYGFWCLLRKHGEDATKNRVKRSTYYRKRKELVDAGVAWTAVSGPEAGDDDGDLVLTLMRNDPRRRTETLDEVREAQEAARARWLEARAVEGGVRAVPESAVGG